jgi:hypothetical protein
MRQPIVEDMPFEWADHLRDAGEAPERRCVYQPVAILLGASAGIKYG